MVTEWVDATSKLLDEKEDGGDGDDIGPRTELAFWRKRATKLNSICDDLKGEDCQQIMLVLQACKSRKFKIWRQKNNQITDALNEAKDNVKYLSTLTSTSRRCTTRALRPSSTRSRGCSTTCA